MEELQKLIEISEDFNSSTGKEIITGLLDYKDIKEFIQILIIEWIPTWKEEDEEENEELYDDLIAALRNLDMYELRDEYNTIRTLMDLAK